MMCKTRNEYIKAWRKTPQGIASVKKAREKSAEKRKKYSQEYYVKNKEIIIARTSEYRETHPHITEKVNKKNRETGKNKSRGQHDRALLKDNYAVAQIHKNTGTPVDEIRNDKKVIEIKKAEILVYRIKKEIKNA